MHEHEQFRCEGSGKGGGGDVMMTVGRGGGDVGGGEWTVGGGGDGEWTAGRGGGGEWTIGRGGDGEWTVGRGGGGEWTVGLGGAFGICSPSIWKLQTGQHVCVNGLYTL